MGKLNTGLEKFTVRVDLGPYDGKLIGAGHIGLFKDGYRFCIDTQPFVLQPGELFLHFVAVS